MSAFYNQNNHRWIDSCQVFSSVLVVLALTRLNTEFPSEFARFDYKALFGILRILAKIEKTKKKRVG